MTDRTGSRFLRLVGTLVAMGMLLMSVAVPGAVADGEGQPTQVPGECYDITGVVNSAATGNPIAGALVEIENSNFSATTLEDGTFTIECVESGNYSLFTSADGYAPRTDPVTVDNADAFISISLVPGSACSEGEKGPITLVLTWGGTISDLDSHLHTPDGSHVAYFAPNGTPSQDYASLDVDDVTYFGPETITVGPSASAGGDFVAGTYQYWVHLWTGGPNFDGSDAVVTMFQCNGQLAQLKVSSATGNSVGAIWQVLTFTVAADGTITATNPIQAFYSAPQGGSGASVIPTVP